MKIFVALTLLAVSIIAEPPVENRYLPPNQSGNSFSAPSQSYGAPGISSGRNTEAVFRGNQGSSYNQRPSSRRPSAQYGAPQTRTPSSQYGAPSILGAPSTQYGTPKANIRAPSSQYGAPSTQYGAPLANFETPSKQYGVPSANVGEPSSQYGAPSANFGGSTGFDALSKQYGTPSSDSGAPSSQYGAPSAQLARQPSSQYGVPSQGSRGNSRYSSRQQAPSAEYGTPGFGNGGDSAESRQYLPPGASGARGRNGYGGDDENSEPANYSFEYMVKDEPSGNDFGHRESRQGDRAEGLYYVLLPDGRKQTVEYEADQDGYKPRISYEDTGLGQGYDRNAQSGLGSGPY